MTLFNIYMLYYDTKTIKNVSKVYKYTAIIFTKGNYFCDFLFAFLDKAALSKIGSTLHWKNLLLGWRFDP